jgi:anti-sigma regulatory factor (Ser/Thr protein kinase)
MLHQTRVFVEGFCASRGLAQPDALRLLLIVEELFTNTIAHGYGGECDEPIAITLRAEVGRASIVYEDAARPYDPLARLSAARPELAVAVEQRPVGHLGVHLVAGLAEDARYTYEGGRNRLTLVLRTEE